MTSIFACGIGIASTNSKNEWLETFYASPVLNPETGAANKLIEALESLGLPTAGASEINAEQANSLQKVLAENSGCDDTTWQATKGNRQLVITILHEDTSPQSVPEAYLKLHLLSHRLVKPHGLSLDGIFACLPNVAWTNLGPIDLNELAKEQQQARVRGEWLDVKSVDKFPPMTDYVVPSGVRIADTARVRLGAYVGEGTTIMHEGFVNFNAGTAGASMIEGRISAGVFVGEGSDLGGGCSTMGTLSGGGNVVISVGQNCLIGANAGIGIALGDNCIVEAGLYVTAGTKIVLLDDNNQPVDEIKARELNGKSDLLFRRNSISGAVECKTNKTTVELNEMLHANN